MTPHFAKAIDPVFLHVLDLLGRIEKNIPVNGQEEKSRISNLLRNAEAQLGNKRDWELAKYAIVSWIDEALTRAAWEGRDWWDNHSLEVDHFRSRDYSTEFFIRAKEASKLSRRDALEVFYVCVVLGFRGFYGSAGEETPRIANHLDLPVDLESWARQTARAIQLGQGRPSLSGAARPIEGAPPLDGKFLFLGTALFGVIFLAITATVAIVMVALPRG